MSNQPCTSSTGRNRPRPTFGHPRPRPNRPNPQHPRPNAPGPQFSYNPLPRPSHTPTHNQAVPNRVRSGTPPPPPGRDRLQGRTQVPPYRPPQLRNPPANSAKVHALLFYWAEDDLGVEDEVLDLKKIFAEIYQLSPVLAVQIPSERSQAFMENVLSRILADIPRSDTLIVYYGGHEGLDNEGTYSWCANT